MANLYGRVRGDAAKHEATRRGHRNLSTTAETWQSIITVDLAADGSFSIILTGKHGEDRRELLHGNADRREIALGAGMTGADGIEGVLRAAEDFRRGAELRA